MGTSGTGIFDDDVALDVRDQFLELLASGTPALEATAALQHLWAEAIAESDDGPVFWLALAATQWKYGVLVPHVLEQAIAVITTGADLERWTGSASRQRARVLDRLRHQLESPQPTARKPRRRKQMAPPLAHEATSPSGRFTATVWENAPRGSQWAPSSQVIFETHTSTGPGGGHVCLVNAFHDQVVLTWVGESTLVIGYPATATIKQPRSSLFYAGVTIECRYEVVQDAANSGAVV